MAISRWTWVSRIYCIYWSKGWQKWWWQLLTGAISRSKLQSNDYHQQTNIQFLQAGCPSCHPTNSVIALKGKKYHIPWTCLPQAHLGVFQLCLWLLIAPGNLGGGGCHASHQPSDASTPNFITNLSALILHESSFWRHCTDSLHMCMTCITVSEKYP